MRNITSEHIIQFQAHLIEEEKSEATTTKYTRDVKAFAAYINSQTDPEITKTKVLEYKKHLTRHYAPASVNSILSSINKFLDYNGWHECKVKTIKIQRQIFANKDRELTKPEYEKLLQAARSRKNKRLYYLMQTLCSTGLRVSELKHIDTEAVRTGKALINCKGKIRTVILPQNLCKMLKAYIKEQGIESGPVFVTRNGKPLDRSNIWKMLKVLCAAADVAKGKVFPHNLRHLFARTYYALQKDIVRLADILGHSSVNTTRIYTMESGDIHRKHIEKLGLLRC